LTGDRAHGAEERAGGDDQRGREASSEEAGEGQRVKSDEKGGTEGKSHGAEDWVGARPTALPQAGEGDAEQELEDKWVGPEDELWEVEIEC